MRPSPFPAFGTSSSFLCIEPYNEEYLSHRGLSLGRNEVVMSGPHVYSNIFNVLVQSRIRAKSIQLSSSVLDLAHVAPIFSCIIIFVTYSKVFVTYSQVFHHYFLSQTAKFFLGQFYQLVRNETLHAGMLGSMPRIAQHVLSMRRCAHPGETFEAMLFLSPKHGTTVRGLEVMTKHFGYTALVISRSTYFLV